MPRVNYMSSSPQAMAILTQQEKYLSDSFKTSRTLTPKIWELVKLRASQINQCAFCIDLHTEEALGQGEEFSRLIGLSAWREMPHYSDEERCALEWCETIVFNHNITVEHFDHACSLLGEKELVDLTLAINAINSWNRLSRAFKLEVGSYRPQH